MPTTLEAPAAADAKASPFESGFRVALAAAREAQAGTAERKHRRRVIAGSYSPFWASLVGVVRAFCVRPMPGKFDKLTGTIEQLAKLLGTVYHEAMRISGRDLNEIDDCSEAVSLLDSIEAKLGQLNMPVASPLSPLETLKSLVRLPNMSAEQICKMTGATLEEVTAEADRQNITLRTVVFSNSDRKPKAKPPTGPINAVPKKLGDLAAELDSLAREWDRYDAARREEDSE